MSNEHIDSSILDKALVFAIQAHANTARRAKNFPYIVHPLEAVSIVATMTDDQDLLAAAALHDTVEDTEVTIEEIRSVFGQRIADLVAAETDQMSSSDNVPKGWRETKMEALERLSKASQEVKMVAMGDKLSNMRAIAQDYRQIGDKVWERFHAPNGKADYKWRYEALAEALKDLEGTFAYGEFSALIREVFA